MSSKPKANIADTFGGAASTEALRILANGLLLHERARDALGRLDEERVGPSLVHVLSSELREKDIASKEGVYEVGWFCEISLGRR